jgi:enoyl-CoA hydratase/carnithine racemase
MANYETVIYETVEDKIRRLTLNCPEKLNALSPNLLDELMQVLDIYEEDPDASVLIIRGAGRAFSAGYDLNAPAVPGQKFTISNDRVNMQRLVTGWQRLWSCIKPTVAQVHGFCLAGATEFVGHCDIVFASEDASFGHPAGRNLGVLPSLSLWPVLMGPRKSKELFFTGDTISAAEAVDWHHHQPRLSEGQAGGGDAGLRAPSRPGVGRTAGAAQGRRQPLPGGDGLPCRRTVLRRSRCDCASDRGGEGILQNPAHQGFEGGAERTRPSVCEKAGLTEQERSAPAARQPAPPIAAKGDE